MATTRSRANSSAGPHAVSLKVLRLSRPSFATQLPLPKTDFGNGLDIDPTASLAFPSGDRNSSFPLAAALTLPSSFGQAYVGEQFSCTLCANNELDTSSNKVVHAVKVAAELQTPNIQQGISLPLTTGDGSAHEKYDLDYGKTLQFNVHHALKEAGPHVLAITLTYTETTLGRQGEASGGRIRSFRKLYQFSAQPLISVRSKVTESKGGAVGEQRRWIIEAQLENVGDSSVVLEQIALGAHDGLQSEDLNVKQPDAVTLKHQDVQQVMFRVSELAKDVITSNNKQLAQLRVDWRGPMGEPGHLTTGWLSSKT